MGYEATVPYLLAQNTRGAASSRISSATTRPSAIVWSPARISSYSSQSSHATALPMAGPWERGRTSTPAKRSAPFLANWAQISAESDASTLTQKRPVARMPGHVVEVSAGHTAISGGLSDTAVKELHDMPTGPLGESAHTT